MNNNRLNHLYVLLHVLIPHDHPFFLQAKEGGVQCFAPLLLRKEGLG